jgi:hypothetical protein
MGNKHSSKNKSSNTEDPLPVIHTVAVNRVVPPNLDQVEQMGKFEGEKVNENYAHYENLAITPKKDEKL